MTNWIPKIGDRVIITGTIDKIDSISFNSYRVMCDGGTAEESEAWFDYKEISPLVPRQPWDVLREAADILYSNEMQRLCFSHRISWIRSEASILETAAVSKPPTLAEAVRAYLDEVADFGDATNEGVGLLREALALEESKK